MQTVSLTLRVPGYDVPAALTLPEGPLSGAALIVPASLFSDVDGNYVTWNSFPRTNAYLAEGLAGRGIASLRFAKLGPGTGSVMTDPALASGTRSWRGRADTARLALAFMRAELAARDIVAPRTVLAGHSEGAVVVSVLARDGVDVDGVALLSGPSVGILEIMKEQAAAMGSADVEQLRVLDEVVDVIRAGLPISEELRSRAKGPMGAGALVNFPPEALSYMRDVDATDPAAAIAGYEKPVLVVQGGDDTSVPPHHARALIEARGARPTTYAYFPELTHMYKHVPAGTSPAESFGYPGPTDPRVDAALAEWIKGLPARPR